MMKQIKSVDELMKLKEAALEKIKERQASGKTTIVVGMGTCGITAGAREVMMAIIDEIDKRNISDVIVTQAGCAGMCQHEPIVEVNKPGIPQIVYGHLDEEKARRLVLEHVINGHVIEEWALVQRD
ncbi:(2Fe-2S) ferredoxin domain-containing protein [Pelotomaculum terephthalicicum JT]|uniref:(2Fe-2S) ferredoxin domain-containing protein n=1 Tax=Pelotomaculum TaxID=191373 RepID=UPI0009CFF92B|nr:MULTISPECIES: (2Fe-2S) ferredoxin domain-containing protein [Pelotomaculum]MCG9967220.1 (2Fe-2S) ferredoxin domain-containing protein [Pelotomaculum terephthalicicum JT]OPX91135.1 MAG: NADP-reducing hydrogenase subunit HndB [Pelotomaculum sp. PtaB.Bin117]OPY61363.1 MAG: NADP-reducing hydrogenase subunit HndB [Pelotomaculum sp. PtaU1.Bin065]